MALGRMLASALAAVIVLTAVNLAAASVVGKPDEADFLAGLDHVEREAASNGKQALAELRKLLADHHEMVHVLRHYPRLRKATALSSFAAEYTAPHLAELLGCEVAEYTARSGAIRLVYSAADLHGLDSGQRFPPRTPEDQARQHWLRPRQDPVPTDANLSALAGGRVDVTSVVFVPVRFSGPHKIRIDGRVPTEGRVLHPHIYTCIEEHSITTTAFAFIGAGSGSITRSSQGSTERLANRHLDPFYKLKPAARYSVSADVRKSELRTALNDTKHLHVDMPEKPSGFLAFGGCSGVKRVEIKGEADVQWIAGLIQDLRAQAFAEFTQTYNADAGLPAWLRQDLPVPEDPVAALTECANTALKWLAAHEDPDLGGWSPDDYHALCADTDSAPCVGNGNDLHRAGISALALMAFLQTESSASTYRPLIERTSRALVDEQLVSGKIGSTQNGRATYDHLIATTALIRARQFLDTPSLDGAIKRALDHASSLQQEHGGWRYARFHPEMPLIAGDASVTGWAVHMLQEAKRAGHDIDDSSLARGHAFLASLADVPTEETPSVLRALELELQAERALRDELEGTWSSTTSPDRPRLAKRIRVTTNGIRDLESQITAAEQDWANRQGEAQHTGRVGYTSRGGPPARPAESGDSWPTDLTESLTAEALLCHLDQIQAAGVNELDEPATLMLQRCLALPPTADAPARFDAYYWTFGSLALSHPLVPPEHSDAWRDELARALPAPQEHAGCARGSWDPSLGPWGDVGGRVYTTAMLAIAAQAWLKAE